MKKQILTISLFLIISICHVQAKKLSKVDIASLYSENKFTVFEAVVYHISDEKSTVYLNIHLHDMQYFIDASDSIHIARFKVFYELYESYESKSPIDTSSIIFSDSENYGSETEMIIDFDVNANFPGEYVLKITLYDLNRTEDNSVFDFVRISKSDNNTAQFFFVTDSDNYPIFGRIIGSEQYFKIVSNVIDTGKMYIRYYDRKLPLAKPPFATEYDITFKFEPDSFYTVNITDGVSRLLELPKNGIYHFQADAGQTQGLTLFHFDEGFPEIASPLQAVFPLRYLTTQKEYDKLINYYDFKVAVDSFWLERASQQPVRAKNMIARYYTRVQETNEIFTSYLEGWKTDRGIIYIIYGPPSEVYRKTDEEEWIYGERGNPMSIKFYFPKIDNPFTDNDYRLHRSTIYKTSWYVAIENWRR
ncbi:MAG: GWxTD domain-containing protein [Bacteroidales bacterium]|nr:GWxTD domain-containing protein [Bacteroidales bacterium]